MPDEPSPSITLRSASVAATEAIGRVVGQLATAGDIIALTGELGSGKTQLVRGIATGIGAPPEVVSSPTYVLVQQYEPADPDRPLLVHVDAYRLTGELDEATLGLDDFGDTVMAIEWADRLATLPGGHVVHIALSHVPGEARRLVMEPAGRWRKDWSALAAALHDACETKESRP